MRSMSWVVLLLVLWSVPMNAQEPTTDATALALAVQVKALETKLAETEKKLAAAESRLAAVENKTQLLPAPTAKQLAERRREAFDRRCRESLGARGVKNVTVDEATNRFTYTCEF